MGNGHSSNKPALPRGSLVSSGGTPAFLARASTLMIVLARFLVVWGALLLPPAVAGAQETQSIRIEDVWTNDGNGNAKTAYIPGDAIQYTTLIRNHHHHPVPASIRFEAGGPTWIGGSTNPSFRIIYAYQEEDVLLPVGGSTYYSPWDIPTNAQPGLYYVNVAVGWPLADGGHATTVHTGTFSIPGNLAANVTTFLRDGITPTSAVDITDLMAEGPGGVVVYRIGITNTSAVDNTGVVVINRLPREIFAIVGYPVTSHGACDITGSWPSTVLRCQLGRLEPHETATVSFDASIIVRNPDGTPEPPQAINNTVRVRSVQQPEPTIATVETAIGLPLGPSDEEIAALLDAFSHCVGAATATGPAPALGTLAGFVWKMVGRDVESGQPSPYEEKVISALELGSQELLVVTLREMARDIGWSVAVRPAVDAADCFAGLYVFFFGTPPSADVDNGGPPDNPPPIPDSLDPDLDFDSDAPACPGPGCAR